MISRDTYIQISKFAIVGILSFGFDLCLYYGLTEIFNVSTIISKSISVIGSTLFNYYLNTTWTWKRNDKNRKRFVKYLGLYFVSGTMNVIANEMFLHSLPNSDLALTFTNIAQSLPTQIIISLKFHKFVSVILATIVGMIVNFLGQKLWVFK